MFRVVVKANINTVMVENLIRSIEEHSDMLDSIEFKANSLHFKGNAQKRRIYSQNTVNQILNKCL